MWLSVGDESLGHYSEVGCFSEEEGLLIEVLPYTSSRDVDTSPLFTSLLECPSSEVPHTHTHKSLTARVHGVKEQTRTSSSLKVST